MEKELKKIELKCRNLRMFVQPFENSECLCAEVHRIKLLNDDSNVFVGMYTCYTLYDALQLLVELVKKEVNNE